VIRRPEFKWQIRITSRPEARFRKHTPTSSRSRKRSPRRRPRFVQNNGRLRALRRSESPAAHRSDFISPRRRTPRVRPRTSRRSSTQQARRDRLSHEPTPPGEIDAEAPAGGDTRPSPVISQPLRFPDLIVPAGFTTNGLPIGISFFGPRSASRASSHSRSPTSKPRTHAAPHPSTRRRPGEAIATDFHAPPPPHPFRFHRGARFCDAASRAAEIKVEDATIAQLQTAMAKARSPREAHRKSYLAASPPTTSRAPRSTPSSRSISALSTPRAPSMPNARPESPRPLLASRSCSRIIRHLRPAKRPPLAVLRRSIRSTTPMS